MDCRYCRYREPNHANGCPRKETPEWNAGWSDGRSGKPPSQSSSLYMMGYNYGMCALEEAQNGFDPRFHFNP